jgi:hypothetical protein
MSNENKTCTYRCCEKAELEKNKDQRKLNHEAIKLGLM